MQFNEDIFKRNLFTDVECVVEGQVFKAHRAVLACFSSFLKRKLGKSFTGKIEIPKVGSNEFEILLNYMYTGTIKVDCSNFFDVYKAASLLEMQVAKMECLQIINGRNEICTYFYAYVLSKKLGVQHNWEKALNLIAHRFEETAFSKEFMLMDIDYALEILSAQSMGARSEIIVFLAALNWLNHDFGSRGAAAPKALACVRFSSMTMEEIVACYHPPFLSEAMQMPEVMMMLFRATCYIAAKSQGQETWFRKYASPKRNFLVESLPMELWHTQSTPSAEWLENISRQGEHLGKWEQISGLRVEPRYPVPVIAGMTGQENKHLRPKSISAKRRYVNCIPEVKEGDVTRLPASQTDLMLRCLSVVNGSEEGLEVDNESSVSGEACDIQTLSSELKVVGKPIVSKTEKNKFRNNIQNTLQTSCSSCEVQPRRTSILHLRQQLLKPPDCTLKASQKNLSTIHEQNDVLTNKESLLQNLAHQLSEEKLFDTVGKTVESNEPCCTRKNGVENERSILHLAKHPFAGKEKLKTEILASNKLKAPAPSTASSKVDDSKKTEPKTQYQRTLPSDNATKRKESSILVIGGMNPKNCKKEIGAAVSIYDPKASKWLSFSSLPEPLHNHCAAILDAYLYVVGGCNSQETIASNRYIARRSCCRLDLESMKWSSLPEMKCCRYDHGMVIHGGQLYVIGGQDENNKLLKSVEVYQPNHNRWKLLNSSMCCGRKAMGVTVYADCIWVAGGLIQSGEEGKQEAVSHVDYYNPIERRWHFNTNPLPGPRCFCSLTSWKGKLYCVGGMVPTDNGDPQATDEVWFADNKDDPWKKGPSLPQPKIGGLAVTCDDNLCFLGGFDPNCNTDVCYINSLRPSSSSWDVVPPMMSHLFGLAAVSYKSK